MRKHHSLTLLLSLGSIHLMHSVDDLAEAAMAHALDGVGGSVPVHPVLDLTGLARSAVDWCAAIIGAVDKSGADGTAKLNSASQGFGETLADNIDSLEARAGVLGAILNAPGINEFEHSVVVQAVTFGGTELVKLLHVAVQNVFDGLRHIGKI